MKRFRRSLTGLATLALLATMAIVPASADHGDPSDELEFHQPQFYGSTAGELVDDFDVSNDPDGCGVELDVGEVGWAFLVPGNPRDNFFTHVIIDFSGGVQEWAFDDDPGDATRVRVQAGNVTLVAFTTDADETLELAEAWGQQNDDRFLLTHVCVAEPDIEITKTAVEDTITVGDHAVFDITVESTGARTAEDVTITDELPNDVLDWEIVAEDIDGACTITNGNTLDCDVGDLAPGDTFTVRVQTTDPIALFSDKCGETLDNTAFADADGVDQVSDDAQIDVLCASILVEKLDHEGDPLAGAEFALHEDANGEPGAKLADIPTVHDHLHCIDGLAVDGEYVVVEEVTPEHFEESGPFPVTATSLQTCDDRVDAEGAIIGDGPDLVVVNTPEPVELTVEKLKLSFADGALVIPEDDVALEGFEFSLYSGIDTTVDPLETATTGADGTATFEEDIEVGETYTVCETGVPDGQEGYWTDPVDGDLEPQPCVTFTAELGEDEQFTFYNAPRADIEVGFVDVTGFTSANIVCVDADGDEVASLSTDESDTLELDALDLGDYECSIEIRNGAAD